MASSANKGSIASRWRELHGKDSWKGLLDPLDIDLRKTIISYGELAEATYDGFNTERRSPHAGACMYGHDDLLASSGAAAAGHYKVTKFIYATSGLPLPDAFLLLPLPALRDVWSRESNFMGYVAVATDDGAAALGRRDVVVAWRGTVQTLEWVNDLAFTPAPAARVLGTAVARANPLAAVHGGFLSLYTSSDASSKFNKASARDQVVLHFSRFRQSAVGSTPSIAGVVVRASTSKEFFRENQELFVGSSGGNVFTSLAYRGTALESGQGKCRKQNKQGSGTKRRTRRSNQRWKRNSSCC